MQETANGTTTKYLVDTLNPTGYAQVIDEQQAPSGGTFTPSRRYTWGLQLVAENQQLTTGNWQLSYYGFDGHGSVRQLFDSAGNLTDTYTYDAFGNVLSQTGSTPNVYMFASEAFDQALGVYYNRARYLNSGTGRFWTMDSYEGHEDAPLSLHKFLYVDANPVNNIDPCGKCLPSNQKWGEIVQEAVFDDFLAKKGPAAFTSRSINDILGGFVPGWAGGGLAPDLVDPATLSKFGLGEVWEIKSVYSERAALAKVGLYVAVLNEFSKDLKWIPGVSYLPPPIIRIDPETGATTAEPFPGVITYCVLSEELRGLVTVAIGAAFIDLTVDLAAATLTAAYGQ